MKEISVVQLPEYLAQSASAIRRIDYDLSIYLEEREETEKKLPDDLMDIFELRDYLPGNLKLNTVRGWMYFQQLSNYNVGKRVYFSKKDINKRIRLHVEKDDVECFKGLTEEDLKAYPVEPEQQQNAETPQRNSPHAAPQSISILDIPAQTLS